MPNHVHDCLDVFISSHPGLGGTLTNMSYLADWAPLKFTGSVIDIDPEFHLETEKDNYG